MKSKSFKQFNLKKQVNLIKSKITSLLNNTINENVQIDQKIWDNRVLIEWLRGHGIEIGEIPSFKKGGSGTAYFLPKNMVVKITDDVIEANIAKMIIRSNIEKNIIDVKKIDDRYAILQKKVDTVNTPKNIKLAADLVTVMIDEFELNEFPDDLNEVKKMCLQIIKKFEMPIKLLDEMILMIEMIKTIYKETGFFHNDAGPTNIGTADGKTYIFDLGPNKTKGYDTKKEIEKINQKREKLGLSKHEFL